MARNRKKADIAYNRLELMLVTCVGETSAQSTQFLVKSNRFICKSLNEFSTKSRKRNATQVSNLLRSYKHGFVRHFDYLWHTIGVDVTRWRVFKCSGDFRGKHQNIDERLFRFSQKNAIWFSLDFEIDDNTFEWVLNDRLYRRVLEAARKLIL